MFGSLGPFGTNKRVFEVTLPRIHTAPMLLNESATLGMGVDGSLVNTQNVHFQEDEYENALFQLNKGLDVFAAVMTMSRRRQTYVLLLFFTDFRDLCSIITHKD